MRTTRWSSASNILILRFIFVLFIREERHGDLRALAGCAFNLHQTVAVADPFADTLESEMSLRGSGDVYFRKAAAVVLDRESYDGIAALSGDTDVLRMSVADGVDDEFADDSVRTLRGTLNRTWSFVSLRWGPSVF